MSCIICCFNKFFQINNKISLHSKNPTSFDVLHKRIFLYYSNYPLSYPCVFCAFLPDYQACQLLKLFVIVAPTNKSDFCKKFGNYLNINSFDIQQFLCHRNPLYQQFDDHHRCLQPMFSMY